MDVVVKFETRYLTENIKVNAEKYARNAHRAIESVIDFVHKATAAHIGLDDHSLKDLADMDHPYATRHGKKYGKRIHVPYWDVHIQSENMRENLNSQVTENDGVITGAVWIDSGQVPYLKYVHFGTRKMIARPFFNNISRDYRFEIRDIFVKEVKR